MTSRFTPETRGAVLQALNAGLTLRESAQRAGLPDQMLKNWLMQGRQEADTEHADFAAAVDDARDRAARGPMTGREFRGCLNAAVRAGSVQAMKVWIVLREQDDPDLENDAIGQLARRHHQRRSEVRSRLDQLDDPFRELDELGTNDDREVA
jgi:hypothetical protein